MIWHVCYKSLRNTIILILKTKITNTVRVWDNTKNSKAYAILLESGHYFRGCAIQTQVVISSKFNDHILLHVYPQGEFHTLTRKIIHMPHWSQSSSIITGPDIPNKSDYCNFCGF